jgi:hypothetical protein
MNIAPQKSERSTLKRVFMIMIIVRSVIVAVMRMKLNVFGNQKADNLIAHSTAMTSREENTNDMTMMMTNYWFSVD